jgi:hypothetical protein
MQRYAALSYCERMGMIWVGYRRNATIARQLLEDPGRLEELIESNDGATSVDLDKAWHGLHWLLTGNADPTAAPLSEAIFGGESLGEDLGYGPGRLLSAARVAAVANALAQIDLDSLRDRMDPSAMDAAKVYPSIWGEDDVFDTYLAPAFEGLRAFYSAAVAANEAIIQTIC